MLLGAMRGQPLYKPLCGAERARKLNERERGVKKYGGASGKVSGNFNRSRSAHMLRYSPMTVFFSEIVSVMHYTDIIIF